MKKLIISGILAISILIFISCDRMAIEDAITTFESAVNDDSSTDMENILSPDSEMYILADWNYVLDHFDGFRPVDYTNLDINIDGKNARVITDSTYDDVPVDGGVKFRMRKDESNSTFFQPSWKVFQYYEHGNFVEDTDAFWKKLNRNK